MRLLLPAVFTCISSFGQMVLYQDLSGNWRATDPDDAAVASPTTDDSGN